MDSTKEGFFLKKSTMSQIIFILIILYSVSAINVLLLAFGLLPYIPGAYLNPNMLIGFSLFSFVLTLLTSAYHLSTMIRRRKRKTDRISENQNS
jgi:membrane protein implicated in regulation of membrane protease activity